MNWGLSPCGLGKPPRSLCDFTNELRRDPLNTVSVPFWLAKIFLNHQPTWLLINRYQPRLLRAREENGVSVCRQVRIRCPAGRCRLSTTPYSRSMIILAVLVAVTVVPSGKIFNCTHIRVWDGDGPIWCAEGQRVRLAGIVTRETDGSCRQYQPCPKTGPQASRDALVRLIGKNTGKSPEGNVKVTGPTMRCLSDGIAKSNRTAACCKSPIGGDLSCAMVRGGWSAKWTEKPGNQRNKTQHAILGRPSHKPPT